MRGQQGKFTLGFTLIELIVVITVIAILAVLVSLGLNKYLENGRDADRSSSITALSEALEKYYDKNGEYPSCAQLTKNPSIISQSVLKGIDESVFIAPNASQDVTTSMSCSDVATSSSDIYQYKGDGSANCATGDACLSFTLRYREESSGDIIEVKSRRGANIATSGGLTISASASSFTALNASWTTVPNALSYQIQASTSSSFGSLAYNKTISSTSTSVSGLSYDTGYYLRVRAVHSSDYGNWSNVINVSTKKLGVPGSFTVTATSFTALSASWAAVSSATSYQLQASTSSTFSSLVYNQTLSSTSASVTGLSYGTTYYLRVRAMVSAGNGNWSGTVTRATSTLGTPTLTVTPASTSQINTSWNAISGATGYNVQWSTNQSSWSSASVTTTSRSVTGLAAGSQYYLRVQAKYGSSLGSWSATKNTYTKPSNPTGVTLSAAMSGSNAVGTANATCAAGTVQYQFRILARNTSTTGSWTAWSGWSATKTKSQAGSVGYQYNFQAGARCLLNGVASGTVTSSTAATVRPFAAPAKPTVSASTSGGTTTFTRSTPACSGNGTLEAQAKWVIDNGGSYAFAIVSGTTRALTTSSQGYNYGVQWQARCKNQYSTSAWSAAGTASYTRPVSAAATQTFSGYRGSATIMYLTVKSSCGAGASLYGAIDIYTYDWHWTPGSYYGWRRNTPLGWVINYSYRPTTTTTGSSSSSGIPSGSRWKVGGNMRCQNSITGRTSGGYVWKESGIYTAS